MLPLPFEFYLDTSTINTLKYLKYLIIWFNLWRVQNVWLRTRIRAIPETKPPIRIILLIVAVGVVCRIAGNFPHQTIFRREETCAIDAAAQIAEPCKTKRSEKSSNAGKCLKKNILTIN